MEYIAFYCAVRHGCDTEKFLVDRLKDYQIGRYLIVRERSLGKHAESDGQHYHFLVEMSNDDYIRYRKRVFIDHFKLRGRAVEGKARQYGKVQYLKDPDRMAIYMCKSILDDVPEDASSNVVATTMTASQLELWHQQSYKKIEKVALREKIIEFITSRTLSRPESHPSRECAWTFKRWAQEQIIRYHVENKTDATVSRSSLESLSVWYVVHRTDFSPFEKLEAIRE